VRVGKEDRRGEAVSWNEQEFPFPLRIKRVFKNPMIDRKPLNK